MWCSCQTHKPPLFTFTLYKGKFNNKNVVLVKSGVGKTFASMICQRLIDKFNIKTVLFTGVGGSLNKELDIGDVVISEDSVYHDFDATKLGFKLGQISYTNYRFFKADKTLLKLALKANINNHKIIKGRILTGDQFFTLREKIAKKYLTKELKGDCIEMEGAAIAQVCTLNKIPHLIIRSMSDKANKSAVQDYNKFTKIVAHNSFAIIDHILKNI